MNESLILSVSTWRLRSAVILAALAGAVASGLSGVVSYWSVTGGLPAALYGSANRFSTMLRIFDVPVELLFASCFLAIFGLSLRFGRRTEGDAIFAMIAIVSVPLAAFAWRMALKPVLAWPLIIVGAAAAMVLVCSAASSSLALNRYPKATWSIARQSWRNPSTRMVILLCVLSTLLAAQAVRSGVRAMPAEVAGLRSFSAWFDAQPRLSTLDGAGARQITVVVYTDYECPSCQVRVPQGEETIQNLAESTPVPIFVETRHFPLDAECNAHAQSLHQSACEAAASVLYVSRHLGKEQTRVVESKLYKSGRNLTPDVVLQQVRALGIEAEFLAAYPSLISEIKGLTDHAATLGVQATPTIFVNGVKLRSATHLGRAIAREADRMRPH